MVSIWFKVRVGRSNKVLADERNPAGLGDERRGATKICILAAHITSI
jgi:hypothetical protein